MRNPARKHWFLRKFLNYENGTGSLSLGARTIGDFGVRASCCGAYAEE